MDGEQKVIAPRKSYAFSHKPQKKQDVFLGTELDSESQH